MAPSLFRRGLNCDRFGNLPIAINIVMGPNHDAGHSAGNTDTTQRSREGLFVHMRVEERASAKYPAIGRHDVPLISAVIPTGVGMAHGDVKPV